MDDISRGLMTRAIRKKPCINLFITYFARADNMLLSFTRGQITCYCLRKMLLPRRQITRRKLCFYYTCKFGVISIQYVIMYLILNCIWQIIIKHKGEQPYRYPFHKKKPITFDWMLLHIETPSNIILRHNKVQCFYCCSTFHSHSRMF